MRQVLGTALAAATVAALLGAAAPADAAPSGTPRVRAAPSRALQDGQTVAVSGSGFPPNAGIGLAQCPAGASFPTACVGQLVVGADAGSFAGSLQVRRFVGSTDCAAAPGTCVLGASNLSGNGAFTQMAFVRLRFGPPATVLQTTLTGQREIGPDGAPGAGDLDAVGAATLAVRATSLCATLTVAAVDLPAVAAHVHRAHTGVNGTIVIPLRPPHARGRSQACIDGLDPGLLAELRAHPRRFYVNIHTAALPNGAVRGQLDRADREGVMLAALLRGSKEIGANGQPGAGDPDGTGVATMTAVPGADQICFDLSVRGIALPASTANIHEGWSTINSAVVVPLGVPDASGRASGCVEDVSELLIDADDIASGHGHFYVNVTTTEYPDGAVRGQLVAAAALAG
jgi:hypothetical protein